jgi:RNA polymerase sigma factor (sigma-70 family)
MEVKLPHRSPPVTSTNRVASDANPEQIWDEFRNGSELAFTALYKKYVADLYHYGERLTDDKQLIEDSIHDLFVELWRQRASYKPVLRLRFYLLKSFRNRLMKNLYKKGRVAQKNSGDQYDIEMLLAADNLNAEPDTLPEELPHLQQRIEGLSPREKQAILLRFYDGLTYEEIASLMTISTRSVYKLMYRALSSLKRALGV